MTREIESFQADLEAINEILAQREIDVDDIISITLQDKFPIHDDTVQYYYRVFYKVNVGELNK